MAVVITTLRWFWKISLTLEVCTSSRNGVCSVANRAVRPGFSIKTAQVGINSFVLGYSWSLVRISREAKELMLEEQMVDRV